MASDEGSQGEKPRHVPKKRRQRAGGRPFAPGNPYRRKKGDPSLGGGRPPLSATEKEIRTLARAVGPRAVERLAELKEEDGMVGVAAANSLLDRGYGKPSEKNEILLRQEQRESLKSLSDEELIAIIRSGK